MMCPRALRREVGTGVKPGTDRGGGGGRALEEECRDKLRVGWNFVIRVVSTFRIQFSAF